MSNILNGLTKFFAPGSNSNSSRTKFPGGRVGSAPHNSIGSSNPRNQFPKNTTGSAPLPTESLTLSPEALKSLSQ